MKTKSAEIYTLSCQLIRILNKKRRVNPIINKHEMQESIMYQVVYATVANFVRLSQ